VSVNLTELVQRPGIGNLGRPVRVRSNFFEVTSFMSRNIHHYDMTIDPAESHPAVYRKVWQAFEDNDGQGILKNIQTVSDGRKNAFSFKPLALGEEHAIALKVKYIDSLPLEVLLVDLGVTRVIYFSSHSKTPQFSL
jgi:hypothetical protein